MPSLDHARVVLAGILPDRRDRLLIAMQKLELDHFRDDTIRNVFQVMTKYHDVAGGVLPRKILEDTLANKVDAGRVLLYCQIYDEAAGQDVPEDQFRYGIEALRDARADQLTGTAITTGLEILTSGVDVGKNHYRGHDDSRNYLMDELARIDRLGLKEEAPEGEITTEADDMQADYAARKAAFLSDSPPGVTTGIKSVDITTSGFQNGELIMVCAYTGEGKSMFVTQTAWHCAVNLGKNVFFATSETIRSQVRRRLLARHSRLPQFGLPAGLNSSNLKGGSLTPDEEAVYEEVIADLTGNKQYGKIYLAQVPRGATLGFIESRAKRQQANFPIDLLVIDYLALVRSERKREKGQEEYNDLIKDAKQLATTFADGRGIPLVSPWAMNQSRWREAKEHGEYTLGSLSETSEAEKSADQILSLLRNPDQPNEVKVQFLKNRDGSVPRPFTLEVDYRATYMTEREMATPTNLDSDLEMI